MTFAAVVLWIKTFLSSVPRAVYTHGLAFIVGVVLRGCLAVALVLLFAGRASAQPCPVNGSNCSCGCQQGGQCNCALTRVAPERLSRLDPQSLAYRDLCEWAERHPDEYAFVYVQCDPPRGVQEGFPFLCRYDAGFPEIKTPMIVVGAFRGGKFVEIVRQSPYQAYPRPQAYPSFIGGMQGGVCRSCR